MSEFLEAILAFPTVLFTIPLGVVVCYWLTVMVGAVGIDLLDGDISGGVKAAGGALEGGVKAAGIAVDGLLDGTVEAASGSLEAGAKAAGAAVDGHLDGHLDGHADGSLEAGAKASSGLLASLGFTSIPVTVSFSTVTFLCWLLSLAIAPRAQGALGGLMPSWLLSAAIALVCLAVGTVMGGVAVRPLRPVFTVRQAPRRSAILGRVCTIASGRVDGGFGHATFEDGGAGLLLHVFCSKENGLKRGDQALILGYDAARDTYEVEPVDWLLPGELQQLKDPVSAAVIARAKQRVR